MSKLNNKNKVILIIFLAVLTLSLVGYLKGPVLVTEKATIEETVPAEVISDAPQADLIVTSELTVGEYIVNMNKVIGTVTNNNTMDVSFYLTVTYLKDDGTPLAAEDIIINDLKAGETKYFNDAVIGTDVSKAKYDIQAEGFVEKEKGNWN